MINKGAINIEALIITTVAISIFFLVIISIAKGLIQNL